MAVVHILNNLRVNDDFLGMCLILARYSIHIQAVHIPGVENTKAVTLSRLMIDYDVRNWVLTEIELHYVPKNKFSQTG